VCEYIIDLKVHRHWEERERERIYSIENKATVYVFY